MKIISPFHEILFIQDGGLVLRHIEVAGRTCYKSEDKITHNSSKSFVKGIIKSGHHSVIEHVNITVRFVCDRGVSHELVRHRLAAFSQESTRYANYSKEKFGRELTVIKPSFWSKESDAYEQWLGAMKNAESSYLNLLKSGVKAEEARSVLPNSLKTEVVMTCNLREWRHVLQLRCSKASHPQMREIMLPLLEELHDKIPVVFDDLYEKFIKVAE